MPWFTYEPYLSVFKQKPAAGRLIADSLQYPGVFDSFGCTPEFIEKNPQATQALVDSYFEALDMIAARPGHAPSPSWAQRLKQTGAEFAESQAKLKWADRDANRRFFGGELQTINRDAAALLLEIGIIKAIPPGLDTMYDARFIGH